jgi:hypothetical protein
VIRLSFGKILDKAYLMRSKLQFGETRFPLECAYHLFGQTILREAWETFFLGMAAAAGVDDSM